MRDVLAVLALLGGALPAGAVTLDPFRDPASAVVPNSAAHPWGGIGVVESEAGTCTGTPVSRRLVLTAAHCVAARSAMRFAVPFDDAPAVAIAGRAERHPGYDPDRGPWEQAVPDVAVIRLDTALPDHVPTYGLLDAPAPPRGQPFDIVGYGLTGTGLTGGVPAPDGPWVKRFARNEADLLDPAGVSFTADFDGGDADRMGSPGLGPTEGMIGFGDSGSPALYNPASVAEQLSTRDPSLVFGPVVDRPLVMGVASYLTIYDPDQAFSSFGSTGTWTSASAFSEWLFDQDDGIDRVAAALDCPRCGLPGEGAELPDPPPAVPLPASLPLLAAALALLATAAVRSPDARAGS
jgi:hypothetical protein